MEMPMPPEDDLCSICHGSFRLPCQANCSHWFCGSCVLHLWDNGAALRPCRCPLCRRDIINLLLTVPTDTPSPTPDVVRVLERIKRYNRVHGDRPTGLFQRVAEVPFLAKRLLRDVTDPQRSLPFVIKTRVYLAMCASFIYVVAPVNNAVSQPVVVGTLGYADDLMAIYMTFLHIVAILRPSPTH